MPDGEDEDCVNDRFHNPFLSWLKESGDGGIIDADPAKTLKILIYVLKFEMS